MRYKIIFFIFILALISSTLLVLNQKTDSSFCGVDSKGDCDAVQNSKYAYAFGISNSVYGIIIFSFLSLISFLQIRKPTQIRKLLIDAGVIIGFLIAIYFIYLQIFVIGQFCKYCLVIDIGMIFAFFLIVPKEISKRRWFKK